MAFRRGIFKTGEELLFSSGEEKSKDDVPSRLEWKADKMKYYFMEIKRINVP
jgi:hypothetical protein